MSEAVAARAAPRVPRFKPYPTYKSSGVEWLGDVPEHWEVKRLKYSATINDEALPDTTAPDYEFSYVDISSVDPTSGTARTEDMVFESAPSRARRVVRDGDTIVSTVRTYLRAIATIKNPRPNLIVSTGFAVVRPRTVKSSFLSYALREAGFINTIVARSVGVSYPAVNAGEIVTIPIPLPEQREQHAIAAFLDEETAKIDALITKKHLLIEKLQEKRSALMSRIVTRGLPADAASAAGLDPHPSLKSSEVEWISELPAHWHMRRIATVSTKITNGFVGPTRDILVDEGVRYLQSLHIKDGKIVFLNDYFVEEQWSETHAKSILRRGDVLIVQTGDIGQVAFVPKEFEGCNCHALIIVSPKPHRIRGEFLSHFLNSTFGFDELKRIQTGALHPHLNCGLVRDVRVPLPPIAEQDLIVEFLDCQTTRLNRMANMVERAIERLQEYHAALITAAVTGKIDLRRETA